MRINFLGLLLIIYSCLSINSSSTRFQAQARVKSTVFHVKAQSLLPPETNLQLMFDAQWSIKEIITNGEFTEGLTGWQATGEVMVENQVSDVSNSSLSQVLGLNTDPIQSALLLDTSLSQTLHQPQSPVSHLGFWYKVISWENLEGFDDPCFIVYADEIQLFQSSCAHELSTSLGQQPRISEWQFVAIDLRDLPDQEFKLTFYAGNTGDQAQDTQIYLTGITTNLVAVNSQSTLQFKNTSPAAIEYAFAESAALNTYSAVTPFSLPIIPDNTVLTYGLTADPDTRFKTQIIFDDVLPPGIENLSLFKNLDGTTSMYWVALTDSAGYDLRVSSNWADFYTQEWATLAKAKVRSLDGLPGIGLRAAKAAGEPEIYELEASQNLIYLAIRTQDLAGNLSSISNPVEVQ